LSATAYSRAGRDKLGTTP